jgi:hypothetical protein
MTIQRIIALEKAKECQKRKGNRLSALVFFTLKAENGDEVAPSVKAQPKFAVRKLQGYANEFSK